MAEGDLTDLDAVRALFQSHSISGAQEELLASLITSASDEITTFTGRELIAVRDPETREFVAAGSIVDLAPCDLREATAVHDITTPTAPVPITSYRLRPKPSRYGVYSWLEIPGLREGSEIAVTGLWGFPEVPERVKHWCGITVLQWYRGDVAAFSTTFEHDEGRTQRPESLPAAVRSALRGFRRKPV